MPVHMELSLDKKKFWDEKAGWRDIDKYAGSFIDPLTGTIVKGTTAYSNPAKEQAFQERLVQKAADFQLPGVPQGTPLPVAPPPLPGAPPPSPIGPPSPLAPPAGTLAPGATTSDLMRQLMDQLVKAQQIEGRGFSPEAQAAMRTQAMESVPAQFDSIQRALATSLSRRGGGLPASGDFMREYGPLLAAKEATKQGLLQDVTLANEAEIARTREADRGFALDTLTAAGSIAGERGRQELTREGFGVQMDIAKLDANTRLELSKMGITSNEKLAEMGITSQEKLAELMRGSQWDIANLDATTRTRLTQMGIDSNEKLAALGINSNEKLAEYERQSKFDIATMDTDTQLRLRQMDITSNEQLTKLDMDLRRELEKNKIDSNELLGKLDAKTRIDVAELQMKGGNMGAVLAAGVASSLIANPTLIKDGIKWIKDKLFPTAASVAAAATATGAASTTGVASAGVIGGSTGFGSSLAAFATNPFTIGIAGALAAGFVLYKKFGTDHLRADQIVQKFENPYTEQVIFPMHKEFFKAAEAGQMSAEQAGAARAEFVAGWEEYQRQVWAWAGTDGSKKLVAQKSIDNLWRTVQPAVGDMDRVIQNGGFDRNLGAA